MPVGAATGDRSGTERCPRTRGRVTARRAGRARQGRAGGAGRGGAGRETLTGVTRILTRSDLLGLLDPLACIQALR
ncbi:hypothetical protein ACIRH0_14300, partial [Streptomyces sp. NPDC093675]